CSCGFYDASTDLLYTESLITYFNETAELPFQFVEETFEHKAEKSWNSKYRAGANSTNVVANGTSDSLELYCDPTGKEHLVVGGSIRTERRDIQYGTFRSLMRGPRRGAGGSSMTMRVQFNETESVEINMMNTDDYGSGWVNTIMQGEWPDRSLGVNYTTIGNASLANGTAGPFDFMELRFDWTHKEVNYWIGNNNSRTVTKKKHGKLPETPAPLYFRHWSTGDKYSMEGPPYYRSEANVGWLRAFFNSSGMTKQNHKDFDERCTVEQACSVDDMTLRLSSTYNATATHKWKAHKVQWIHRSAPIWISVICIAFSTGLLIHAFIRRAPWRNFGRKKAADEQSDRTASPPNYESRRESEFPSAISTPTSQESESVKGKEREIEEKDMAETRVKELGGEETKQHPIAATVPATLDAGAQKAPIQQRQRVDYLAGLVALCSIFVTLIHFHLTYVPGVVIPGASPHYQSELWAARLISPFIMNQMWLGVFFTTSTRFLAGRYLREGNLLNIAERAVKRVPRLMIPVTALAMVEYFLIDVGAVKFLEYVPSVSWSTWAYVTKYDNFGIFVSEILELVYLIPNAAPQITNNYCTGVLWTIAVQLQGSWVVLLGAIVVREIKTPWKRFGYYAFCVVNNWYARNWGTFFWLGVLLTDLDVTYKYRKWLYPRPWVYYPLLNFFILLVIAGFTFNIIPAWYSPFNFTDLENDIHPDFTTGRPLGQTDLAGYPQYFTPRMNMLFFAVGMQAIVEISTTVQKCLSFKVLVWLFPHIFTIYLIHGFVFWSWGSWLCVYLATHSFPYWLNMLIVGLSCYGVILLALPIVTPAIEIMGRDLTLQVWQFASEKPPPRRSTLYPF
ncbi:glycoside hydrolase family 16 protein, partial [Saccharata proteae CBS 121410]